MVQRSQQKPKKMWPWKIELHSCCMWSDLCSHNEGHVDAHGQAAAVEAGGPPTSRAAFTCCLRAAFGVTVGL
jgi:hypothetical protein